MRKGLIEITTFTVIAGIATLFLKNIHETFMINKRLAPLIEIQQENCVENPTEKQKAVCEAVNNQIAKELK